MIEQIKDDIFRIEIPLYGSPLKSINDYFIRGREKNLIIDTAFNYKEGMESFQNAMKDLDFDMSNTDIFCTHIHADHCGLVGDLVQPNTKVYCSQFTSYGLTQRNDIIWQHYYEMLEQMGLACDDFKKIHPGYTLAGKYVDPQHIIIVEDGERITVGDRVLTCIETSGHAPEHMCLYDANEKLLFCGDHILNDITPNNTIWEKPWGIQLDSLGDYLKNLDKVDAMDVNHAYCSHRSPILDFHKRVQALREHHWNRLDDVRDILKQGKQNAEEIASQMKWSMRGKPWGEFPLAQKIFAVGEAAAHVVHLQFLDEVEAKLEDGIVYYKLTV